MRLPAIVVISLAMIFFFIAGWNFVATSLSSRYCILWSNQPRPEVGASAPTSSPPVPTSSPDR